MIQEISIYVGLIAAVIGASAALLVQYIASFLTTRRECKKLKRELIAEERCLAYLLSQYTSVFIDEVLYSAYYLRFAAITFANDNKADNSKLYEYANEAIAKAQELDEKIRITNANYFKVITHFTNLTKNGEKIISLFEKLEKFERPKHNSFSEIKSIIELGKAKDVESIRFKEIYKYFSNVYEEIFKEMKKAI